LHGGSWHICDADYLEFLRTYAGEVDLCHFGFVERRNMCFPFLLDIDFYSGSPEERLTYVQHVLQTLHQDIILSLLTSFGTGMNVDEAQIPALAHGAV
jgi:hypothetical protein